LRLAARAARLGDSGPAASRWSPGSMVARSSRMDASLGASMAFTAPWWLGANPARSLRDRPPAARLPALARGCGRTRGRRGARFDGRALLADGVLFARVHVVDGLALHSCTGAAPDAGIARASYIAARQAPCAAS